MRGNFVIFEDRSYTRVCRSQVYFVNPSDAHSILITQQFVLFAQDFLVELAHTGLGHSVDKADDR